MKRVFRERTIITIVAGLIFVTIFCVFGPENPDLRGLSPRWFRYSKLQWHQNADVIIAGDSRVMCDMSPDELMCVFPNARILNFGFASNALSQSYLKRVSELLDPKSSQKVIILGITPQAFTKYAVRIQGKTFSRPKIKSSLLLVCAKTYFDMDRTFQYVSQIGRHDRYRFIAEHFSNGWMASDRLPPQVDESVEHYRQVFSEHKVKQEMIPLLITQVKLWREQGIKVYALRPPVDKGMLKVEDELSGFNEQAFINDFQAAGGIWLPKQERNYSTYDGHHLRRNDAVRFSKDIARSITTNIEPKSLASRKTGP